ncbi:MAG: LIC_13355 family lipoprotein [Leptonema sp. (in: bacteria)]
MLFFIRNRALYLGSVLFFLFSFCREKTEKDGKFLILSFFALENGGSFSSNVQCPKQWRFDNIFLANKITEAPGGGTDGFKNPTKSINGICGGGKTSGSLDVYSLQSNSGSTLCVPNERCIVLEWEGKKVKNVAGVDFVVFENPFCIDIETNCFSRFMEPVIVEVSEDGINWCGWNPQYIGPDTSLVNLRNPNHWLRFAGKEPVLFNQETWVLSELEIFDPSKAGGDGFDLDDGNFGSGCTSGTKTNLQTNGFIYLRLVSAVSRGFSYPSDSFDQTADIDGVVAKTVINR